MESFFHGKSSGLDPLNSYLSIPILINSKDHIEATGIPTQSLTGKGAVLFAGFRNCRRNGSDGQYFYGKNLKDQGFPYDA